MKKKIVRRSPPRHSPPQTFTTSDVHHPLCKIRRSPPQTFTTSDVHHLRRSPPQTFTTPDVHHPQCKIRRSPPQTFTTPDVHHLRRSPPQTFTTSDIHHPQCKIRRSPPQTFTTPDVHHLRRSPPQTFTTPSVKSDVHHPRSSQPPILKCYIHHQPTFTIPYNHHPRKKNSPTLHQGSRVQLLPPGHWIVLDYFCLGSQLLWLYKCHQCEDSSEEAWGALKHPSHLPQVHAWQVLGVLGPSFLCSVVQLMHFSEVNACSIQ